MGKVIRHVAHEACGSSDGLALYEQEDGSVNGYCYVCKTYEENPGGGGDVARSYRSDGVPQQVDEVSGYPVADLSTRGITARTAEHFGVRQSVDERTGEPDYWYFPVYSGGRLAGYKKRSITEKSFSGVGSLKDSNLFGQHLAKDGGTVLVITEGEVDAMTMWQVFQQQGKNYRVVSLPHGANTRHFVDNMQWVDSFKTVVLCLDQDDPGIRCAQEIAGKLAPGKTRIMRFTLKDANEMLLEGRVPDLIHSFYNSNQYKPEGTVLAEDIWDQVLIPPEMGKPWPWESLTKHTYGRRRGEIYGFGAGTGIGKSDIFREVQQHILLTEDSSKIGIFALEEENVDTIRRLAAKMAKEPTFTPENWDRDKINSQAQHIKGRTVIYDHQGTRDWEEIKRVIRHWVIGLGVYDIFIDHLTALTPEQDDTNRALGKIMSEMASLTTELQCTIYFISHLSTPQGKPHEEGGRVTISQFRGSRTIGFWSHFLFGLERNQQAEEVTERNTTHLRILKDRYTGRGTGEVVRLVYDPETVSITEREEVDFDTYDS